MSALGPHSLNAACRAIFVQAAEDHILPRILRDASDPESPRRYLEAIGAEATILFWVVYDEPARGVCGQIAQPPLRFEIEARGIDDEPLELDDYERGELIRAFLLGVREPLLVEGPSDEGAWRIALKVAPRFVMWAPSPERLDDRLSTDEVCERLADRLTEQTWSLLSDVDAARTIWAARLREELFGEPRPTAHELWPAAVPEPAPVRTALPAIASGPAARVPATAPYARRRRSMAAAMALIGLAAFAGAYASRGDRAPVREEPARLAAAAVEPARTVTEIGRPAPPAAAPAEHAVFSPAPTDVRFAMLAPAVAQASRYIASPAAVQLEDVGPLAQPVREAVPPLPPRRPVALSAKPTPAPRAQAPRAASPLVQVDRAMKKFVKSLGARMHRVKVSALNSPHAAGPR